MLRLILFLIFLIASIWLGILIVNHPGYLLVVFKPWMVQMPIWFALVGCLVILVIFYLIITSFDQVKLWSLKFKNWWHLRCEFKSYSKTQRGLSALIEGRWKKAEALLLAGVSQSVDPLMNYLGAAKAAHEQAAFERRDNYIQTAYAHEGTKAFPIGITQAELEIDQQQYEQAAATLNHLKQKNPYNPKLLKLLEKVYVHLGDWQNLLQLLPAMRKGKVLTTEQLLTFEKNVYCEILHANAASELSTIQYIWYEMPRHVKKNPDVVCAYVEVILRFQEAVNEIEELIRKTLKSSYQGKLVKIYSTLPFQGKPGKFTQDATRILNRQLVIAGAWLKLYGQQPELLLLLGKLCVRIQLWGKAKDYFTKCLAAGPNVEASLAYGKLLEELGEFENALHVYRDALISAESEAS